MKIALRFREQISKIGNILVDELDALNAGLSAWSAVQHDEEGGHGSITVDAIGSNSFDRNPAIPIHAGLKLLYGPLIIDADEGHAFISPDELIVNTNNFYPAFFDQAIGMRLSSDAAHDLTGIMHPVPKSHKLMLLLNKGNFTITLKHNTTSDDANRFALSGNTDVALLSGMAVWIIYDVGTEKWRRIE